MADKAAASKSVTVKRDNDPQRVCTVVQICVLNTLLYNFTHICTYSHTYALAHICTQWQWQWLKYNLKQKMAPYSEEECDCEAQRKHTILDDAISFK